LSKRVRRRVGEAKSQTDIGKQWISYPREMVESPALRVRSQALVLIMHRIEAEHMAHGAAENGNLVVTRRQFEKWGIHRDAIAPASREGEALGFFEIRRGHAGVGGNGKANRFRLTYVNDKHRVAPTHEWQRITTIAEAEKIAREARAEKNPRALALGKRSARKKISVTVSSKSGHGIHDRESINEVTETMTTRQGHGIHDHYLYLGPWSGEGRVPPPEPAAAPRRDLPVTVWPIEGSYLTNGHRLDEFAAPRHIVRDRWKAFQ
jgi:hypothetical protein